MFNPQEIFYINPFYFKNGNTAKDKYFIVLGNIENKIIIASLPTSKDRVPRHLPVEHGCLNDATGCFNCYHFSAEKIICENGFRFPRNTFLYGDEVDEYNSQNLDDDYVHGIDYENVGRLTDEEFNNLLACIKTGTSVKRKIKRYLFS